MQGRQDWLRRRAESLRFRINSLTSLRQLVALTPPTDISARQWSVIEPQLAAASARLTDRVRRAADALLPRAAEPEPARELVSALGRIELDLSTAFTFFDTYMDVLTQRRSPELGAILAGCDALALDAVRRDHPVLAATEPPLVYCDRGLGAAIFRESVAFPDGSPNPMPLIQIPYSRLKEKHNLTSILHEAGHQALYRLQLVGVLPKVLAAALEHAGAAPEIRHLYGLWAFEIGPDFWAFGLSGVAEAAAVRELFALPSGHALRVSFTDPHPPPYLRALLCFDWCRRAYGAGPWDDWERDWLATYPLSRAPAETRRILHQGCRFVPVVGQALFQTRFRLLGGRRLLDLLDVAAVAPDRLRSVAAGRGGKLDLGGMPACAQLAAFRMVREWHDISEDRFDRMMTDWLLALGAGRRRSH
jgi:hypothetical protein